MITTTNSEYYFPELRC